MIKIIKPERILEMDYLQFLICHKMAKMGTNADAFFDLIDADGSGEITE